MKHYGFSISSGELHCEERPVRELAKKYGTPLYVYSQNHFLKRLKKFKEAFAGHEHLICFAVKSNSNLAILNCLAEAGCGFDIVSGGELQRVLEAGAAAENVVYAGVGKTAAEQRMALRAGIRMFNVESLPEMIQLNREAARLGESARIAFRVNPDVDARTHAKITTGKEENKFGIPAPELLDYARRASELSHIRLEGLHFHIGSQITDSEPFVELGEKARRHVLALRDEGFEIRTLNLGGGLGISYDDDHTVSPRRWAQAIMPAIEDLDLKLIVEPGRFLIGNAGILVTSVVYLKESISKNFIIVDAGMNTLIRPAMYDAYHEIAPVVENNREIIKADIVGPVCETGDSFGENRDIARPESGELLALFSAGAYGFSMASNYNSFPRPAEVMVNGKQIHLIRERETYEELWRGEKMCKNNKK